jgi:C4-type Zn-finger protein
MVNEGDICPVCKKGTMEFQGDWGKTQNPEEPFEEQSSMKTLICSNKECKHKDIDVGIKG